MRKETIPVKAQRQDREFIAHTEECDKRGHLGKSRGLYKIRQCQNEGGFERDAQELELDFMVRRLQVRLPRSRVM